MPTHHRRTTAVRRGPRRKLVWAVTDVNLAIPAAGLSNLDLLAALEVAGSSTLGVTVMRTHITVQVPFVSATDNLTLGLIVGRAADLGAGLGPNPASAPEDDWMWLERVPATASGAAVDVLRVIKIDSRAKRKMDELQMRYIVAFLNGNAAVANVRFYARTLVALP